MLRRKDYTTSDLEDSLKRAFVDKRFPAILFDGKISRNEFLRDGINYGLSQGWLYEKSNVEEPQYTAVNYALTDEGKRHFGLLDPVA
ncbi:MAG: hypothetical protein AABX03_01190 [Nanoarchaeota archaeon]